MPVKILLRSVKLCNQKVPELEWSMPNLWVQNCHGSKLVGSIWPDRNDGEALSADTQTLSCWLYRGSQLGHDMFLHMEPHALQTQPGQGSPMSHIFLSSSLLYSRPVCHRYCSVVTNALTWSCSFVEQVPELTLFEHAVPGVKQGCVAPASLLSARSGRPCIHFWNDS